MLHGRFKGALCRAWRLSRLLRSELRHERHDALVWSAGAAYLSGILLSAGMGRTVNRDERIAILPALPDQGADEISIWADPLSRLVHTVMSRMPAEVMGRQLARIAEVGDQECTTYLSFHSDVMGKPA